MFKNTLRILIALMALSVCIPESIDACLANGSQVNTPNGVVNVESIQRGDAVYTGSVDESGQVTWSAESVEFIEGANPGSYTAMIYVQLDGDINLVVTRDTLFLIPNGKLKRADNLVPDRDQVIAADGSSVNVVSITTGAYKNSLFHLTSSMAFNNSLDGHLIDVNGIVLGDYTLQVYQDNLRDVVEGMYDKPQIGTESYSVSSELLISKPYGSAHRLTRVIPEAVEDGYQQFPDVAFNTADQTFLVVWEHVNLDGMVDIHGVMLDGTDGSPIGDIQELIVEDESVEAPEITYNANANQFLLIARRKTDQMVLGRLISGQGEPLGESIDIDISRGPTLFDPASRARVASIVYNGEDDRYFIGLGEPMSAQILFPDLTLDYPISSFSAGSNPAVSWSSVSNVYLMAFEDRETRNTGNENLSAQIFDNLGVPIDDPILLRDQDFAEESPRIAYSPHDDEFLVVWDERIGFSDTVSVPTTTDIFGQIIDVQGNPIGIPLPIEATTAYSLRMDAVYNPVTMQYFVVWKGDESGDFGFADIFGRFIHTNATFASSIFLIHDEGDDNTADSNNEQYYDESKLPVVDVNTTTGDYFIVWEEGGTNRDPNERHIKGRFLKLDTGTSVNHWGMLK